MPFQSEDIEDAFELDLHASLLNALAMARLVEVLPVVDPTPWQPPASIIGLQHSQPLVVVFALLERIATDDEREL